MYIKMNFQLNEIFQIVYVYVCMHAIDYKVHKSRFKILMLGNND